MKPIHKFNNGNGATLCNCCSKIISIGLTEDLYCSEECKLKYKNIKIIIMTLKEKFKNINDLGQTWEQIFDAQVEIADDYAIKFAEWIDELGYVKYPDLWISLEDESGKTAKELLEIFKKEKGL